MDAILSIIFAIIIFKLALRILPGLIGFTFSLLFGLVGVLLVLCLLPFLGVFLFGGDILILLLLLMLVRRRI